MTPPGVPPSLREWTRRAWGALSGRRTDHDLQRELAEHLAIAEDELRRQGRAPNEAARLARAAAGGRTQALEALREQRGLPWLGSSWLDVRLGLRLLVRSWGLTLVGGLAMSVAIGIAAVVFAAFDVIIWSRLPLEEGDRIVAIQIWDREAGQRRDTPWQDIERWRGSLQSVDDVGAFQTIRRNVITADGSVELVAVAEISAAGFRVARVPPLIGRGIVDADLAPGAAPVIVIGHDVWQRRFAGARDVIGRELRLGETVHTVVGVMPDGFQFPFNFRYWVPLQPGADEMLRNTGPEGVVFGRLAPDATLARAHAEVSALGILPSIDARPNEEATGARVVPYTFAFTGDFEHGELGLLWSLSSLALVLLLLPPCANIAILNYARTVTRQQEFAARHALGGSRARIVWQLYIESLVLTAAAAGVALLILRVVSVVMTGRLQDIPGGPPFWMTLDVSYRTLLFVAGLAVAGAAVSGLVPALQATGRLARLGAGALAGRTSLRLGTTWTALVIAQVAFSVGVLPLAAELAWGTLRSGVVGPGFAAEEFATARVALEDGRFAPDADEAPRQMASEPEGARRQRAVLFGHRQRELARRLLADPGILGVAAALRPPGEEPWVFVDIEGRDVPTEVLNGQLPGFRARFNQVDAAFFDIYQVPGLAGRGFEEGDVAAADVVIVNRNFADTIAPGGNALGRRFRYVGAMGDEWRHGPAADRWYEVVGVVGNLPVTTEARVAYHRTAPGQIHPAHLQLRLRGDPAGLAERLRDVAASVDPALQVDQVRTLAAIYREHRFGDNLGALTIGAVTGSVLLLSAAGLYALMAFTVAQRRREIGIRSALGAQPGQLMAAVFRRVFWQIGAGSAVGMLAAYLVGRYVPIEQIGGLPIPGVLPGAAAFMLLVGVLAALGPARRGLRIDPTEALRSE
ncbi:MAG TPA: ABC transporter permease [Vicinamibacterales bacterium]|nr:ABC transporter permease [Vicinamibacterales bacterium]